MAKIYARAIHDGRKTLAEVPERYREATRQAYYELFGKEI